MSDKLGGRDLVKEAALTVAPIIIIVLLNRCCCSNRSDQKSFLCCFAWFFLKCSPILTPCRTYFSYLVLIFLFISFSAGRPTKMAPTTQIETVTITRPLKVIINCEGIRFTYQQLNSIQDEDLTRLRSPFPILYHLLEKYYTVV